MMIYFANYDNQGMTAAEDSRYQHMAGCRLLQMALSRMGMTAERYMQAGAFRFSYAAFGKPYLPELPGVHFNISHTEGLVVCAVSQRPVGIDAERIRPYPKSVLRKMTDSERSYIMHANQPDEAFMRVWTMKEAMIKLTGEGLAAFTKTEAIPGQIVPDQRCRQWIWQGRYVITAIENTK